MNNDLYWVISMAIFIAGGVALLVMMVHRRNAQDEKHVMEALPIESLPTPMQQKEVGPVSFMEQREIAMADAKRTGRCMYGCNAPAAHPYPAYKQVRSFFDPLLRWLGVKQLDRWRVSLGVHWFVSAKEDLVICTAHQQRIVGLLEEHQVSEQKDIAKYLNAQCLTLYEYGVSEVHGVVANEMKILRDPKKQKEKEKQKEKQAALVSAASNVVELSSAKKPIQTANGS